MKHAVPVPADLTGGDTEMQRIIQETIQGLGGLDIIVNRCFRATSLPCMPVRLPTSEQCLPHVHSRKHYPNVAYCLPKRGRGVYGHCGTKQDSRSVAEANERALLPDELSSALACSGVGSTDVMREGTPEQAILSGVRFCLTPAKIHIYSTARILRITLH